MRAKILQNKVFQIEERFRARHGTSIETLEARDDAGETKATASDARDGLDSKDSI